jgi:hypothetical protein
MRKVGLYSEITEGNSFASLSGQRPNDASDTAPGGPVYRSAERNGNKD